jgi:5-methylcytosine-specific restriction endonuclease McrA
MFPGDSLPLKNAICEHWKDHLPEVGILIDWREPGCWACGFNYGARYNIRRSDSSWNSILDCWNKIPLQRCHIMPRSLGGTDSVENLFLMCRECHDVMPNTSIPEIFFRWARAQDWDAREDLKTRRAFESFRVLEADYEKLREVMISTAFKSWVTGKFGLHRPQSNYAPISSRLTPATMIGLAQHFLEMQSTDRMTQIAHPCHEATTTAASRMMQGI